MTKSIHIYIHDSWEERNHPRAENGQFGQGGGSRLAKAKEELSKFEGSEAKENKGAEYKKALREKNKAAWEKMYGQKKKPKDQARRQSR